MITGKRLLRLAVVLVLFGCGEDEPGPAGPGVLRATVQPSFGQNVGAVVLETTAPGIRGFDPLGSTILFSESIGDEAHRLVLLTYTFGELEFQIRVRDLEAGSPEFRVVEAVDIENLPLSDLQRFRVRITR